MKQEMKHSVLIASLLALALAGCQKQEEAPAPEMAPETTPEMAPEAPTPMSEPMAPSDTTPPEEPPPAGDMPATPPAQ
jgi:PBP1b-binding outer membrane lipoprotein LpoB